MENYTSRTCLNCERVNLFLVANEIAPEVGNSVKKIPTAVMVTPLNTMSQYRWKFAPGSTIFKF
jgi:hypothetical protein